MKSHSGEILSHNTHIKKAPFFLFFFGWFVIYWANETFFRSRFNAESSRRYGKISWNGDKLRMPGFPCLGEIGKFQKAKFKGRKFIHFHRKLYAYKTSSLGFYVRRWCRSFEVTPKCFFRSKVESWRQLDVVSKFITWICTLLLMLKWRRAMFHFN